MRINKETGQEVRHTDRLDIRKIRVWYKDGGVTDFDIDDYNKVHEVTK